MSVYEPGILLQVGTGRENPEGIESKPILSATAVQAAAGTGEAIVSGVAGKQIVMVAGIFLGAVFGEEANLEDGNGGDAIFTRLTGVNGVKHDCFGYNPAGWCATSAGNDLWINPSLGSAGAIFTWTVHYILE